MATSDTQNGLAFLTSEAIYPDVPAKMLLVVLQEHASFPVRVHL